MSAEDNQEVVRRYLEEAFNEKKTDLLYELVAEDCVDHHIPPELPKGPQGAEKWFRTVFAGLSDIRVTLYDLFAAGDKVAARFLVSGTHDGEFLGIPATGNAVAFQAMAIVHLADGKIVEWWETGDSLTMMQQLGAVSAS